MAYDYIRRNYSVNPRVGQRIKVDGRPGVILHTDADPMYLRVRFDGADCDSNVHPTWNVDYGRPNVTPRIDQPRQVAAHG